MFYNSITNMTHFHANSNQISCEMNCSIWHSNYSSYYCIIYRGVGKIAIFDWNCCLSRKQCEIGLWLLLNVNRKSGVSGRISFSMTLSDPKPGFQGHGILTSRISQKRCILGKVTYRILIGNHTQSIERYHFEWPWVTSDPDFKVTTFFDIQYRRNDTS